nr:hypothetical protein [Tepidiformaceae bacterium]
VVGDGSRSEFIERAIKQRIREIKRAARNAKDAAIYARLAADPQFKGDAEEALEFAVPWWELGDDVQLSDEVEARIAREHDLRAAG